MSKPYPTCDAKTRSGGSCDQPAGNRTNHPGFGKCWKHGGASPLAEVAGQVALAHRDYQVMGVPVDISPQDALLECIRIAAGEVAYFSTRISELEHEEAIGPVLTTTDRPLKEEKGAEDPHTIVQEIRTEQPQLHIFIRARQQAMDRLVNYSATALRVGLEERLVRVAEMEGEVIAIAIAATMQELGVPDSPEVRSVVRRNLTIAAQNRGLLAA